MGRSIHESVACFLTDSAALHPDKTAVVSGNVRLTYADLEHRARGAAGWLSGEGVEPGDRVVIASEDPISNAVMVFATLLADAVLVVLPWDQKPARRAATIADCEPRLVFDGSDAPSVADRAIPEIRRGGGDLCCLFYTSGSEGSPKGVMMTHRNISFAADTILAYLRQGPADIVLNALPLSFDYGLYNLLMPIRAGGTVVLSEGLGWPYLLAGVAAREGVTIWPMVPSAIALLLAVETNVALPELRVITSTGATLPGDQALRLSERFPRTRIYPMYGLTECKRAMYLDSEMLRVAPDSVGRPIAGTSAWLEDELGNRITGSNEVGELCVSGPHVMQGYWRDPAGTAAVLRPADGNGDRTLRTGDLFRRDDEGLYYFVARADDLINVGATRVSPRETEREMRLAPGVRDVFAFGVDHAILGQTIAVAIEMEDDALADAEALRDFAATRLERELVPTDIHFVDAFPRTERGKVDRRRLIGQL